MRTQLPRAAPHSHPQAARPGPPPASAPATCPRTKQLPPHCLDRPQGLGDAHRPSRTQSYPGHRPYGSQRAAGPPVPSERRLARSTAVLLPRRARRGRRHTSPAPRQPPVSRLLTSQTTLATSCLSCAVRSGAIFTSTAGLCSQGSASLSASTCGAPQSSAWWGNTSCPGPGRRMHPPPQAARGQALLSLHGAADGTGTLWHRTTATPDAVGWVARCPRAGAEWRAMPHCSHALCWSTVPR